MRQYINCISTACTALCVSSTRLSLNSASKQPTTRSQTTPSALTKLRPWEGSWASTRPTLTTDSKQRKRSPLPPHYLSFLSPHYPSFIPPLTIPLSLLPPLPLTIHPSFLPSCALSFPLCVRLYVCVSMCAPASLFLRVCLNSRAHCISTHMHGYVCMKIRTHARTHALTTGARACLQGIRVVIHRRVCICTGYQCSREPSGENCTARGQHVGVYATCNTEHNYYFAY